MRTRSHTITTAALTAALTLTALTSCSDDDSTTNSQADNSNTADASDDDRTNDAPDQDEADQEADLINDLNAYTAAYFQPDAETAHSMMSERCRNQIPLEEYAPAIEQAAADYGALEAEDITVDQIQGTMARVSYIIGGMPAFEREQQPWVHEDGQWRYDAC